MRISGISTWTLGVLALAAAGCGGSATQSSSSSSPTSSSPPAQPTTAAATTTASAAASSGKVTPPGTKLAVGATAVVPYKPPGDVSNGPAKERLEVTVTSIAKGALSDFNGIQLDASEKASTPYYVRVRLKNVGTGNLSASDNDPSVSIEGVDNTGQTQQSVTFIGDFPKCNDVSPPKSMTSGKSFETCLTFLVPGGITAAAYTGSSDYIDSPVTWK